MSNLTYIVSDLHIGSKYFLHDKLTQFLDHLPENAELILNGDTIDIPHAPLSPEHQKALDRIIEESNRRNVIWVSGNHDENISIENMGAVHFKSSHNIDNRLAIIHGHDFDNVMPYNEWFINCFKFFHDLRIKVGAPPIHIAEYAKNWSFLYKYLRKNVLMNAIEYCKEKKFQAITCGHVHFAEDVTVDGIRYINSGAWTEQPIFCVKVNSQKITLENVDDIN